MCDALLLSLLSLHEPSIAGGHMPLWLTAPHPSPRGTYSHLEYIPGDFYQVSYVVKEVGLLLELEVSPSLVMQGCVAVLPLSVGALQETFHKVLHPGFSHKPADGGSLVVQLQVLERYRHVAM